MEDEIEDIVGDVKYTDSQKSVSTVASTVYSTDFTECESKNSLLNSSAGRETYVIESDSEDSEQTFPLVDCVSAVSNVHDKPHNLLEENKNLLVGHFNFRNCLNTVNASLQQTPDCRFTNVQCGTSVINTNASTSVQQCCITSQEIFTQTSKTIIELAETETTYHRSTNRKTLETQTSLVSITENKTVETIEYKIEMGGAELFAKGDAIANCMELTQNQIPCFNVTCNYTISNSFDDESSKFPVSETENEQNEDRSETSSNDQVIEIVNDTSKEKIVVEVESRSPREYTETDETASDIEQDSLMGDDGKRNDDVKELRHKLAENPELCMGERYAEPNIRQFGDLTPLSEESKRDSLMELNLTSEPVREEKEQVLFTSRAGMKIKLLEEEEDEEKSKNSFRLPPIQNRSCPTSPHLSSLFGKPKLNKAGTLPSLVERQQGRDRWEIGNKNLAAGECPVVGGAESPRKSGFLPPIHGDLPLTRADSATQPAETHDPICIKDKIKDLKMSTKPKNWAYGYKAKKPQQETRSTSPISASSPEESKLCDIADRGCETLCLELLRRLRSNTWHEVIETLEEIPKVLEKFWGVITEYRIADIVRQVTAHVESPRPQVARMACGTVAYVLKNTNYTKKPDFYEAVTTLLIKTGSYSRPVRRAANVALDEIVCGVDFVHSVTALCIHGVGHKNALVRCAAARLLVVCCALAGGGRDLLRARPASAATARRHALRALATLLEDKTTDTRKYAERLYSMLRPLSNFEAYYLTDVDVELASRQMKKYDQLLLCGPPKDGR